MKTIWRFAMLVLLSLFVILPAAGVVKRGVSQEGMKSPRTACLKKCQVDHRQCLVDANGDQAKITECDKAFTDCSKACPEK